MMEASSLQLVFGIVDLAVVALAIGIIVFFAFSDFLPRKLLEHGGKLILIGLALAVLAHVWEIGYEILGPQGTFFPATGVGSYFSIERIHLLISIAAFLLIAIGLAIAFINRRQHEDTILDTKRELEASKYFEYQAEERFRYLFDSTSNSVYCYRFDPPLPIDLPIAEQLRRSYDAILQDCNVNFARELDADDPSEVVGGRLGELDSSKDTPAHETYFKAFIDGDYHLNAYELNYKTPSGEDRAVTINMVGIVRDGLLHRMWAVENNTLDLQQTKAALLRRRKFQALVAAVSSKLVKVPDESADATVEKCMRAVCRFADADRSTMFWLDENQSTADIAYIWSPDGSSLGPVAMYKFPYFAERLLKGEIVQVDDVSRLPENSKIDSSTLEDLGVKSLMVLPLVVAGDTVGGITFGRLEKPKDWTEQDVEDLTVFAELFGNFVLRLKSRRALDEAMLKLEQATDRLKAENVYLREEIELSHGFDEIVGQSDAVLRCLRLVEQVAPTTAPVLISGETGTGKELIARAIHELSSRCNRPLVKVNCAALPANLVESELFGHEKGAFTGADNAKRGRFDLAHGSTLFLDEIGEIPVELQAKLLRVLQEGEFDRLGGTKTVKVDVRVIVATNRDLVEAVKNGEFRSDLYYRVNTFPIVIPALRDRGDDIQLLTEHFVHVHATPLGREVTEISSEMMNQLCQYHWPGNVRELEGIVQRALISSSGPILDLAEPLVIEMEEANGSTGTTSGSNLRLIEREHIVAVLEDASWKISGNSGAAAKLGIPPSTLRSKMKKLSIARPNQ
ncbi:MAG: GAF domain-containing protein [Gammaproteobacteria bacterium]|nr:GAF domain-containing protein [Gammaproteobacteria bacterium]